MRVSSIIGSWVLASSAQATLVSIQVPPAVRKGEEFTAHVHVQSAMSSGEVAYFWGELPDENSRDKEMGHILLVTPARSLNLGMNAVRVPGIQWFDGKSPAKTTLKVRVITYAGVGGYLDHFNCQATIKSADRTSSELVMLDCER